jgi:hypothetical protein
MRPHQRLVGDVEARRTHTAGHHVGATLEEILVVTVDRAAIGEHQSRLSLPSGATAALRVVGGRGRHVSHVDEVKIGDVHAEFHRGRTNQIRQAAQAVALFGGVRVFPAEAAFAALAFARLDDLGGVFAGFQRGKHTGGITVKALEKHIHRRRGFDVAIRAGAPGIQGIKRRRAAIAQTPEQATGVELKKLVVVHRVQSPEESLPDQECDEAVEERVVVCRVEAEFGGQVAAEFAPFAKAESLGETLGRTFAHEPVGRAQLRAGFVQPPKLVQVLFRAAADLLLVGFLQTAGGDGEFAPELIQECANKPFTVGRGKGGDGRMKLPAGVVGAQCFQPAIANTEQADVFQVWLHDAPAAPQIFVDAIFSQLHKHPHHFLGGGRNGVEFRVLGDAANGQTAGGDDRLGDAVKGQFVVALQRGVQGATEQ